MLREATEGLLSAEGRDVLMVIKIFKSAIPYPDESGRFSLSLPRGAKVLTAQIQNETPVLWAEVDPAARTELRPFYIVNTGQPLDFKFGRYIATFASSNGIVWHLYELDRSG